MTCARLQPSLWQHSSYFTLDYEISKRKYFLGLTWRQALNPNNSMATTTILRIGNLKLFLEQVSDLVHGSKDLAPVWKAVNTFFLF